MALRHFVLAAFSGCALLLSTCRPSGFQSVTDPITGEVVTKYALSLSGSEDIPALQNFHGNIGSGNARVSIDFDTGIYNGPKFGLGYDSLRAGAAVRESEDIGLESNRA